MVLTAISFLPVTSFKGQAVARQIKARYYLECSAKDKVGVKEVFDAATRAALEKKKSKGCKFL